MALPPFCNEPALDCTVPANRKEFADALARVKRVTGPP
jgi:hypothetical protein